MNLVALIFGGLITWRIADMLVKQRGPLDVFVKLRAYLAEKQKRMGGLFDMISCFGCATVLTGAVVSLCFAGSILAWIGYTLAFSAVATLTERVFSSKS